MINEHESQGFAERVKQARGMAGLTQSELAERAGTVARQISLYESGAAMPRRTTLERLAHALGTDTEWLLSGEGTPPQVGAFEGTVAIRKVPLISWVQAPNYAALNPVGLPDGYIPAVIDVSANAFALRINGISMVSTDPSIPSFPVGTIVIFDPLAEVKPGDFVLHLSGNDLSAVSFRHLIQDGTTMILRPLNVQYPAETPEAGASLLVKAVAAITIL
ncbi:helix-turn-helix domain-containing protein [Azotobacter salinestris]|uniref:helix-turn-helix domain-containing protein n=1 Tax=Azotobacter salinestris TaxID=69964 RepID=UPI0032DE7A15